jgi:hypothetical protein
MQRVAAGHLEVTSSSVAAAVLNAWATGVDTRMFAAEGLSLAEGPPVPRWWSARHSRTAPR